MSLLTNMLANFLADTLWVGIITETAFLKICTEISFEICYNFPNRILECYGLEVVARTIMPT